MVFGDRKSQEKPRMELRVSLEQHLNLFCCFDLTECGDTTVSQENNFRTHQYYHWK